jgi:hypothetical protein
MKTSVLKLSLILAAIVCTQIQSVAFAQSNPRSGYQTIKVQEFLSSKRIKVTIPKAIAVQLFSSLEEEEGRKSEDISIAYPTRDTSVIVHTIVGLADDSVGGIRNRIEMRRSQNKWQIVWVGRQQKCQPGRGHQNWSSVLCS